MFTRLVIHLSNEEIVCVPWRRARPLSEHRFPCTEQGFAGLTDYLRDWQNVPTRIAVDLIEEDFRVETLPHLRARDRAVVLERRMTQLYRATPFRMATLQGREAGGRRDDIALCTAITQNDSLVACLDALAYWRIPVLGVYPAALLGEQLLRALKADAEQLVLVTLMRRDALRISFFQRGRLKFSRISQPVPDDSGSITAELREEMRRTLQYVGSQAWFLRGSPVRTLLLADPDDAQRLAPVWQDSDSPLQVVSPQAVARRLGLRTPPGRSSSTALLLHLLVQRPPQDQMAPRERTRDGRLWYLRSLLFGASAAVAAIALLLAGLDVLNGLAVRESSAGLASTLRVRESEIAAAQARLPVSSLSPDRMNALVRFHHNEVLALPQFQPALQALSLALERQPDLHLRRVVWLTSTQRPAPLAGRKLLPPPPASASGRAEPVMVSGLMPRPWFQELRVEGTVTGNSREPALANAAVERFAADLRHPGHDAEVVHMPFDIDPRQSLTTANVNVANRDPDFAVRVTGGAEP